MKQRVFNLIILDESGSMSGIESQAINGVNETIQTIRNAQKKHEDQEHFLTLVSFNSGFITTIYDSVEAEKVEDLSWEQYDPAYTTPLYDAMGDALTKLRKKVTDNDVVLVTIITDGYENASREYNRSSIKALVDELKHKDWVFTYIGANQDVEKVAASISVTNTLSWTSDEAGTEAMFAKEARCRARFFDKLNSGHKELADNYFDADDKK